MNFRSHNIVGVLAASLISGCSEREQAVDPAPNGTAQRSNSTRPQIVVNSIGMKLAPIPAGEFLMGSPDSDPDAADDERPQHRVRITAPFYMGIYEVTQQEYERIMGTTSSFYSPTGAGKDRVAGVYTPRFPAEQVRWYDAAEFCRRLSALPEEKQARRVYRLPTEAEWEYACRAGTTTAFHYGDALSSHQANFNGEYPYGSAKPGPFLVRTNEVGSYEPNAFGLYDMHGNVQEWCNDWYARDYYRSSPVDDPTGPESGLHRVIRGGEWYSDARDCRSAFRYGDIPGGTFYVMGFRVAMQVDGRPQAVDAPDSGHGVLPAGEQIADGSSHGAGDPALLTAGEDWPQWRGPRGDGSWHGPDPLDEWPDASLPRVWQQPIGGGYGGVAVAGGRVYVMDRQGPASDQREIRDEEHREFERVLCLDALTGRPLWSHAYPVDYQDVQYGNGPRATPTVVQRRVYTLGATGRVHCLDVVDGSVVWEKDLLRDYGARIPVWGLSASPVVLDDLVIVHPGGEPDACLIAFNRHTGDEVWRSLPDEAGYATPIVIRGRQQIVAWTPSHVRGLDPRTGELLWSIPFVVTYGTSIATPIFRDNVVLVSSYYEGTKAIELGPEPADATLLWEDRRNLRGLMCQPLYRDGHVYLLDKRFGLTCFELRSGKKLWDDAGQMTPKGRNPQATMVRLGDTDRALVLNSEGDLLLARLTPAGYEELARTNIIPPTWAHPAYAGGYVFARNDTELVCVQLMEP